MDCMDDESDMGKIFFEQIQKYKIAPIFNIEIKKIKRK